MQRLTCVVFIKLAHYYGKRPCQPCTWSTCLCTSLVSKPMIMVFGLGTILHVRMCTTKWQYLLNRLRDMMMMTSDDETLISQGRSFSKFCWSTRRPWVQIKHGAKYNRLNNIRKKRKSHTKKVNTMCYIYWVLAIVLRIYDSHEWSWNGLAKGSSFGLHCVGMISYTAQYCAPLGRA